MCTVVLNRFDLFAAAQPWLFIKGMQANSLRINAFLGLEPLSFAFAPEKNIKIKFHRCLASECFLSLKLASEVFWCLTSKVCRMFHCRVELSRMLDERGSLHPFLFQ